MNELHLHLDGSISPETCLDLYKLQRRPLPANTAVELAAILSKAANSKSLSAFIDAFDIVDTVLQQNEAIERVTYELVKRIANAGIDYAEIRYAPVLSTKLGLSQLEVVQAMQAGVSRAQREKPVKIGIILCLMPNAKEIDNLDTVEIARQLKGTNVCALDCAGKETSGSLQKLVPCFTLANNYGIPFTMHAGEIDAPENVDLAIQLGAKRIGHGTCIVNYPELMKKVREHNILIECCLSSNFATKAVDRILDHPIKKFYEYGIPVCLSSDDPTFLNTNLGNEWKLARDAFLFTYDDLAKMDNFAGEYRFLK